VPEGGRHSHLLSFAGKLAAVGATGDAIEAAVVAENAAACDPPMPEGKARHLAADIARRYGETRRYALTDLGNAERLADLNADELRHVAGVGWYRWDGQRSRRDEGDVEVLRCAAAAARSQYRDLAEEGDDDRSSRRKWAHQSESRRGIEAAIKLATALPPIATSASDLDADPYLFNVRNGTVDLRTGELREHRQDDLITKLADVEYRPGAVSAAWDDFLAQATGDDVGLIRFLGQAVGYSLAGVAPEEILFYVHGPGNTGKTSLIEAVKATFGDYSSTASFATFTRSKFGGGIPTDIAALAGVRLAIASEVDEGQSFDVARIKQLTGGDTVRARFLYRDAFEFKPQLTLWFVANARPAASADDDAFWRRIRQIPFLHVVPEKDRDPAVKQQLTQDPAVRSAILAWAVDGYRDWQENGFVVPDCVRRYTAGYRAENDPIGRWLDECCVVDTHSETRAGDLVQSFTRWWEANGDGRQPVWHQVAKKLTARGCMDGRAGGGIRYWRGVEIGQCDAGDAGDATSKNLPYARANREVSGNGVTRVTRVTDAQNDAKSGASAPPTDPKGVKHAS
jgi:putative DNA primase/helicase